MLTPLGFNHQNMKQTLQLRLGQQLTMTPQLQQAIRLLQLSTLELQLEVQQALDSNLMLEIPEDEQENEVLASDNEKSENNDLDANDGNLEKELTEPQADIPNELPVDSAWDDIYEPNYQSSQPIADDDNRDFEARRSKGESLQDHLLWQMRMARLGETDAALAIAIIDSINDDGYLNTSLEEILEDLEHGFEELELEELEAVLHLIQNFDPAGVGARCPRECMIIQLRQMSADTPWRDKAIELVSDQLNYLVKHDHNQLLRRLRLDPEDLQEVIELVRSVNPRPGSAITQGETEYVVPDVFVKKHNGVWRVELNPEATPKLRVNHQYANLIRRADNSDDNTYLRNHLQEARWFIKSLQSRCETLLKVATCIVERQRGFLDHGEEAMKPLVLRDVADVVDMHESTISRVTTRKYMHTPRGVFELKYFFSSHVGTADGGECSATAIRALIKKLIGEESCAKPLSDNKLATILKNQGINVARRTVAKYREAMSVPPSNERKRIL